MSPAPVKPGEARLERPAGARLATGCSSLDRLLGGGLEFGALSQLFGEGGSGKTSLALQAAVAMARTGKRAVYIDTEGLSPERFRQIAGPDVEAVSERVLVFEPRSFLEQSSVLEEVERVAREGVGVVVWDSATFLYRLELGGDEPALKRELGRQMATLLRIARERNLVALVTNQIYTDIDHDALRPLGGSLVEHLCKTILQMEKTGKPGRRRVVLRKHRSLAEGASCEVRLTDRGLEDVPDEVAVEIRAR